jgi:hypothetical protein
VNKSVLNKNLMHLDGIDHLDSQNIAAPLNFVLNCLSNLNLSAGSPLKYWSMLSDLSGKLLKSKDST